MQRSAERQRKDGHIEPNHEPLWDEDNDRENTILSKRMPRQKRPAPKEEYLLPDRLDLPKATTQRRDHVRKNAAAVGQLDNCRETLSFSHFMQHLKKTKSQERRSGCLRDVDCPIAFFTAARQSPR